MGHGFRLPFLEYAVQERGVVSDIGQALAVAVKRQRVYRSTPISYDT